MGNSDLDNEKLLSEIDSLEDETDSKIKNNSFKNKWITILIIIALMGISILYFGDYYYNYFLEKTNEEYYESNLENYLEQEAESKVEFEKQKNNITIKETLINPNKELIAVLSNDNSKPVTDLVVEVIFYNGENKPIEIDTYRISIIEENSKCYVKFTDTPENFERYEFLISKEYYWYDNTEFVTDKISYELEKEDDYVNLKVKNNYTKTITEANLQIVYYDEKDNVIDIEDITIYDIKRNKTENQEIYLTILDKNTYEEIEYSRYEINLIGAYIY